MSDAKLNVLILTETWLNKPIPWQLRQFKSATSPPSQHQGIMILANKEIGNLQPLLPSTWSENIIVVLATLKDNMTQIVIEKFKWE